MRELIAIIRREYTSRVKSKWFIISTIGAPILMVGFGAFSVYMGRRGSANDRIVLADQTGQVASLAAPELEDAGFRIEVAEGAGARPDSLDVRVEEGDIGGYVILRARDLDEATELARSCPLLDHCEIMVRPVFDVPAE